MQNIQIAMIVKDLQIDGISAVVLRYARSLEPGRFALTILAGSPIAPACRLVCAAAGIRLVELPARKGTAVRYLAALLRALWAQKYQIVHVHGSSATMTLELAAAWLAGVPVRLAHCHNTACIHGRADKLLRPLFYCLYTEGLACSEAAGRWLFGRRPFRVLPNGVEPERYRFDPAVRARMRAELGMEGRFVIGHVGRLNAQKNQPYLLEAFRLAAERDEDAVLLLVGDGPERETIRRAAERHPYRARILLYGETERPEALYAAMDVFAFPSRYEGFGLALLEAQLSGLPCVASDAVPRDAVLRDTVRFLPITEAACAAWAEALLAAREAAPDRDAVWRQSREQIARFDIRRSGQELARLYSSLAGEGAV